MCIRRMAAETVDIVASLQKIHQLISTAASTQKQLFGYKAPQLVAVSKTKPVEMIVEAYGAGQRHFGENYVQELLVKANDPKIVSECPDILWHFIGHLQRNKVSKLVGIKNLWMVETVDSAKLAEALNSNCDKQNRDGQLNVMLEVNTSGEANKHGIKLEDVIPTAELVLTKCPRLKLSGLMTIGALEHSTTVRPNPDFVALYECHKKLCSTLHLNPANIELSMGMSDDFEHAIVMGSTEVRVGSKIFGSRVYHSMTDSGDEKEST